MGPSDVILEPNEKVLLATRPLFLWEPLVILDIGLLVLSLFFTPIAPPLAIAAGAAFVLLTIWIILKWIPWSATWFVLTETERRPALFLGTSSDRIGSPEGTQSYYLTGAKYLPIVRTSPGYVTQLS